MFAVLGVFLPYWSLWLAGRGFNDAQIGRIQAVGTAVRALAIPMWGQAADRRGAHRRVLLVLGVVGLATTLPLLAPLPFAAVLLLGLLFGASYPAAISSLDAMTVLHDRRAGGGLDYARMRLWGSLSFLLVCQGGGVFLEERSAEWVLRLLLIGLGAVILAGAALPGPVPDHTPHRRAPVRVLLADRRFVTMLAAATLIQGSHGAYYAFSALHWQAAGIGEGTIGLLWAEGVVAEVLLFAVARRLLRWAPESLFLLGAGAAVLRWLVLGSTTDPAGLAAVQWLHALSFGATHLAAIRWIGREVPSHRVATAQALLSGCVFGLGQAVAMEVAGETYGTLGGGIFGIMAAGAAAGGLAAVILRARGRIRG